MVQEGEDIKLRKQLTAEEKEDRKRKRRNYKKNKRKRMIKKDSDDEELTQEQIKEIQEKSSVWSNPRIPTHLKKKYVDIEVNPMMLIVGNIPPVCSKEELKDYFQTLLVSLRPQYATNPPIKYIEIGATKNFAILGFVNIDLKRLCKKMDNLEYRNHKLIITKCRGFFDKVYPEDGSDPFKNEEGQAQFADSEHKLYMGGLPTYLKSNDVKKLCESFGTLKFFNLVCEGAGVHAVSKGYCFFEYVDPKSAENALQGLNNLEIGDRRIKVSMASTGTQQSLALSQNKNPSNQQGGSYLASYPGIINPMIQKMLNIPLSAITPSRVVQFLNMGSPEDLVDDDYFDQLLRDVGDECCKYGNIEKIEIPRPDPDTGMVGVSVGKVFVMFDYVVAAKKCRYALNGRFYNNRVIVGSFYNEELFNLKDYLINI